jgi:hypothetical protein
MTKKAFIIVSTILFVISVLFAFLLMFFKYKALGYGPIDFPYYFQFIVKVFDSRYTQHLTMHPEGANVFGIAGIDGAKSFHATLHFELMKYFSALSVRITDWPLMAFIFIPCLYYLPLVYIFLLFKNKTAAERIFAVLISVIYVLWPATAQAVGFDLRPWIFLTPILLLLLISVYENRPNWEIIVFFNLLFLVREEALFFNAIFLGCYILRNISQWREKSKLLIVLVSSYAVWAGIIVLYYYIVKFPGFANISTRLQHGQVKLLVLSAAGIMFLALFWYLYKKGKNVALGMDIFLPVILVLPFVVKFQAGTYNGSLIESLIFSPRTGLLVVSIIGLILAVRPLAQFNYKKLIIPLIPLTIIIACLFLFFRNSPMQSLFFYRHQSGQFVKLWNWHRDLNRFTDRVITDFPAFQAFNDYEEAVSYERLPSYINNNPDSHTWSFPANSIYLKNIMPSYDYLILKPEHSVEMEQFAKGIGISLQKIDGDSQFSMYKIINR